ncbi:MAG: hypothetical protein QJR03_12250 [Sphaerobacter sp.]|nr:hypothetical protein [Sphaerobacter sp.]
MERHSGTGRLLDADGAELARVQYDYQIDRHNRVWHGVAVRIDGVDGLVQAAGPATLEVASGAQAPVSYYQRRTPEGVTIVFTGRGAPPGE